MAIATMGAPHNTTQTTRVTQVNPRNIIMRNLEQYGQQHHLAAYTISTELYTHDHIDKHISKDVLTRIVKRELNNNYGIKEPSILSYMIISELKERTILKSLHETGVSCG